STAGLSSSTGDTIRIFPSTSSWYFLTSTNPTSGCQSTDSIFIDVVPLPIVEAGPNVDACAGGDLQLQASPAGGVWTDEQGNIIPNGLFNSTVPDTYKVYYTFTNAEGCSATDSTRVCVLSIPQADFQIDATAGCQPLRISATNNSNVLLDCSPATYTWRVLFNGAECHDDNSGWTFVSGGPNTEDATFLFTLSGRYAIELEVTNACGTSSYREEVIVGDVPSIQLTELPNLCNEFEVQPTIDVLSDCNGSRSSLVWTFDPTASLASWQGENPPLITYSSVGQKTITVVATNDCGSSSQTINFNIFELPDLNVNNDGPKCEGENIQLSAGSSNSSLVYLWAGPENFSSSLSNPLLVDVGLSNAGTYVLQAIDTLTGCSNVDSTLVVVDTLTVVSAGADMDFCPGDGSMRLTGTPSGGAWSGITTTGLINPANQAAGTYLAIYTVTNSFGCSSSDTANITIHPPALEESFIDVFCAEDSIILNGTRYNINNPRGQEVFVSSQTGCDSLILDVDIEFISLSLSFRRTNPSCFGDSNGSIIIDTILGGTAPYAVDLDGTGASIVSDFPFVIGGLQAGSYNLTIEDVNGCQLIRDDLQIFQPEELIIKLGRDTIIELGDSIELRVLNDDGRPLFLPDSSIRWEIISSDTTIICPACPTSITVRPLNMTSVTATYTNDNGCSSFDDLVLSIDKRERVYIPNAFTPNGDGFNDRFTIFSDNDVERIKLLRIFDRWGDLVFEMRDFLPNDPDLGWDGYFKGQRMNPAVFAYYAEVLFKDGRIEFFKGDVTLVR
ncbi:MAG: gliding motility-associated C-terminal domain-containing protein, partial [Bacteroidota bacterium]